MYRIAIVNYQAGNLRSVQKALEKVGAEAFVTSNPDDILTADGVVFPGQGACDSSMQNLRSRQLDTTIKEAISNGKPFLGVCLGMQLLLQNSDEGDESCLGILNGSVRELPSTVKRPHMGWNQVQILNNDLLPFTVSTTFSTIVSPFTSTSFITSTSLMTSTVSVPPQAITAVMATMRRNPTVNLILFMFNKYFLLNDVQTPSGI